MFPISDDSPPEQTPRQRAYTALYLALGAFVAAALVVLMLSPEGVVLVRSAPRLLGIVSIGVAVIAGVYFIGRAVTRNASEKPKRLNKTDFYSVIDRLVNDLDDDEAAYLQRRLDEREAKRKDDLTDSLDDLLEQRDQQRRSTGEQRD